MAEGGTEGGLALSDEHVVRADAVRMAEVKAIKPKARTGGPGSISSDNLLRGR
jgi:hypothetical protein